MTIFKKIKLITLIFALASLTACGGSGVKVGSGDQEKVQDLRNSLLRMDGSERSAALVLKH